MGISAGFGFILSFFSVPTRSVYSDFYINFGNLWMEWNIKRWTIFLRVEGKYSVGIGKNLLGRSFVTLGGYGPPVTLGLVRKW